MVDKILEYICIFLALIVVLPVHEFAHAFVAVKFGDNTPKLNGRYNLNPLSHFDVSGLICFLFTGFGWAKPVPVNPYNFTKYKAGCFWVSVAGVIANILLAFLIYPLFILSIRIPQFGYFTVVLKTTLIYIFSMSIGFSVFNLIPVYPLDGFRAIDCFAKKRGKVYRFLREKGYYVLLVLLLLGVFGDAIGVPQLDVLGYALNYVSGLIQYPISAFWGLFFYG